MTLDRLRSGLHLCLRVSKLSVWYSAHTVFHLQYMLHFLAIYILPIEMSHFTNDCLIHIKRKFCCSAYMILCYGDDL